MKQKPTSPIKKLNLPPIALLDLKKRVDDLVQFNGGEWESAIKNSPEGVGEIKAELLRLLNCMSENKPFTFRDPEDKYQVSEYTGLGEGLQCLIKIGIAYNKQRIYLHHLLTDLFAVTFLARRVERIHVEVGYLVAHMYMLAETHQFIFVELNLNQALREAVNNHLGESWDGFSKVICQDSLNESVHLLNRLLLNLTNEPDAITFAQHTGSAIALYVDINAKKSFERLTKWSKERRPGQPVEIEKKEQKLLPNIPRVPFQDDRSLIERLNIQIPFTILNETLHSYLKGQLGAHWNSLTPSCPPHKLEEFKIDLNKYLFKLNGESEAIYSITVDEDSQLIFNFNKNAEKSTDFLAGKRFARPEPTYIKRDTDFPKAEIVFGFLGVPAVRIIFDYLTAPIIKELTLPKAASSELKKQYDELIKFNQGEWDRALKASPAGVQEIKSNLNRMLTAVSKGRHFSYSDPNTDFLDNDVIGGIPAPSMYTGLEAGLQCLIKMGARANSHEKIYVLHHLLTDLCTKNLRLFAETGKLVGKMYTLTKTHKPMVFTTGLEDALRQSMRSRGEPDLGNNMLEGLNGFLWKLTKEKEAVTFITLIDEKITLYLDVDAEKSIKLLEKLATPQSRAGKITTSSPHFYGVKGKTQLASGTSGLDNKWTLKV